MLEIADVYSSLSLEIFVPFTLIHLNFSKYLYIFLKNSTNPSHSEVLFFRYYLGLKEAVCKVPIKLL